jgi:hypothetical protein
MITSGPTAFASGNVVSGGGGEGSNRVETAGRSGAGIGGTEWTAQAGSAIKTNPRDVRMEPCSTASDPVRLIFASVLLDVNALVLRCVLRANSTLQAIPRPVHEADVEVG